MMTDFEKYAALDRGISSMTLDRYQRATNAYIIQAQLLYLASTDEKADISLYFENVSLKNGSLLQRPASCWK